MGIPLPSVASRSAVANAPRVGRFGHARSPPVGSGHGALAAVGSVWSLGPPRLMISVVIVRSDQVGDRPSGVIVRCRCPGARLGDRGSSGLYPSFVGAASVPCGRGAVVTAPRRYRPTREGGPAFLGPRSLMVTMRGGRRAGDRGGGPAPARASRVRSAGGLGARARVRGRGPFPRARRVFSLRHLGLPGVGRVFGFDDRDVRLSWSSRDPGGPQGPCRERVFTAGWSRSSGSGLRA